MYKIVKNVASQPKAVSCDVTGTIPEWLTGTLFRNGPAKFIVGKDKYKHLFDGLAMVHKYSFSKGMVTYQSQFIESQDYKSAMASNRIVVSGFGTAAYPDPCKNIFWRHMSFYLKPARMLDNTNVNVLQCKDQLFAMTETNYLHQVDPKTLDTIERVNLSKFVAVHTASAHPHQEEDGTIYNLGTSYSSKTCYNFVKYPKPMEGSESPIKRAEVVATIPCKWPMDPSYYHSFAMTENYLILIESPICINVKKLIFGRITKSTFGDSMHGVPNEKCIFHVINKKTGEKVQVRYVAEPFFVFHHINAYEDNGHIVMDAACYRNIETVKTLYLEVMCRGSDHPNFEEYVDPEFRRYVIPLDIEEVKHKENLSTLVDIDAKAVLEKDGSVLCQPEILPPGAGIELPRINYALNGKKYRYAYGIIWKFGAISKLVKVDAVKKTTIDWSDSKGPEDLDMIPGEPVFVQRPGAVDEDDGVILSPVISTNAERKSYLLVLDAKSFTEIGRAEQPLGVEIAVTFHGLFSSTL